MDMFFKNCIITVAKEFKVGDMPPTGYTDIEEWWNVQKKGGIKQVKCGCGKLCFPQELSGQTITKLRNSDNEIIEIIMPFCIACKKLSEDK